jgi:hypothetical protein
MISTNSVYLLADEPRKFILVREDNAACVSVPYCVVCRHGVGYYFFFLPQAILGPISGD